MALEQPTYKVIGRIGEVELREYQSFSIAECEVSGAEDLQAASSLAFGRLFAYISGRNSSTQKIAMTTPVRQVPSGNGWKISFVVPSDVAAAGAPVPNDPSIRVIEVPAGTYAALRYRGFWNGKRFEEKLSELKNRLQEAGFATDGEPIGAVYNPPITPPPLRRNEVMLRVNKKL